MIIEMRTYTVQPGSVATVEERFGQALPTRAKLSPLHLLPTTNPGDRKNVSTAKFIRSIKNAPTIGTTTKACGAGPWRRVSACMLAIAVAVAPSQSHRMLRRLSHSRNHARRPGMLPSSPKRRPASSARRG